MARSGSMWRSSAAWIPYSGTILRQKLQDFSGVRGKDRGGEAGWSKEKDSTLIVEIQLCGG